MCNNPIDNNSLVMICAAVKQNTLPIYSLKPQALKKDDFTFHNKRCQWQVVYDRYRLPQQTWAVFFDVIMSHNSPQQDTGI